MVRDLWVYTDAQLRAELESMRRPFPDLEVLVATCPQPGCRAEVLSMTPQALVSFSKALGGRFHVVESEIKGLGQEKGPQHAGKIWVRFELGNPPAPATPAPPATTPAPPTPAPN
jgi:hypothetical protein